MDYLCGKDGISPSQVYGYEREELTHNAVAIQIAENSADAGLGIYSVAKLYNLDFVPICIEEYDLIIPDSAMDTPAVRCMLDTLRSDAFRGRILEMGGYTIDNPGKIIEY